MENLFVTATNLYSLRAIISAHNNTYYLECGSLTCAGLASIIYHLSETKHGMNSVCLKKYSNITLKFDRFFAVFSMCIFLWKYKQRINKQIIYIGSVGLIALGLSESQHIISLPLRVEKILYLITHPIWHICAFHCAYMLVK